MIDKKLGKRKGQEEIVGFVIVVVLVAVIALVFLGIMVNKKAEPLERKSGDVSAFLESAMKLTSPCSLRESMYLSLSELIRNCYENSLVSCTSGQSVCDSMNNTVITLIDSVYRIGPDRPYKGYMLNFSYVSNTTTRDIFFASKGNCSFNLIGGDAFFYSSPGNIRTTLKLCY